MTARRGAATKQNDENNEYVLKRVVSQGKKLKDEHLEPLAMYHTLVEMRYGNYSTVS